MGDTPEYHADYPTRPIGGGNPYHCCSMCGRSDPSINGRIEGHAVDCLYRRAKEAVASGDAELIALLREEVWDLVLVKRGATEVLNLLPSEGAS